MRSMSNSSWGTRAEKVVKTPASSGRFRAASRNRSVTDAVASTPLPSRSSIMKSKPPVELSPWIGGGWRTATLASRTCSDSLRWSSPARPTARSSGVVRWCHSSRITNAVAALVWLIAVTAL